MISALDISTSGLIAQRTRLDTISGNIANVSTMVNENGEMKPYQPRFVVFQADEEMQLENGAMGVKVSSVEISDKEPDYFFNPDHPHAIQSGQWKGYVARPPINMTYEFVDALEATRAYEANIGVIEITKSLGDETLTILA